VVGDHVPPLLRPDPEMLLLVVAEHAGVAHRKLYALAPPGASVDQVARKNDPIVHSHRQAIQKLERFILATVKIADHYCSIGGVHTEGCEVCRLSIHELQPAECKKVHSKAEVPLTGVCRWLRIAP